MYVYGTLKHVLLSFLFVEFVNYLNKNDNKKCQHCYNIDVIIKNVCLVQNLYCTYICLQNFTLHADFSPFQFHQQGSELPFTHFDEGCLWVSQIYNKINRTLFKSCNLHQNDVKNIDFFCNVWNFILYISVHGTTYITK